MLSPPNVSFDILAEGRTRTVSWTQAQSQDGFLAFDRNDDGMISDGRELFGNATPMSSTIVGDAAPDGFAALSFFDLHENGGNGNGRLDSGDSIFDRVVIWIDGNHDGVSQIQELKPLKAVGLVWMDLSPKEAMRRDIYGNLFRLRAHSLVESGGRSSLRYAYDVFFVSK